MDEDLAEFHTVDTVNGNIWLISSPEKVVRVFKVGEVEVNVGLEAVLLS